MKKTLNAIAVLVFLIISCTKESEPMVTEVKSELLTTKFSGDGAYDALGQGYDITGEYLKLLASVRPPVIDIAAFKANHQGRIILDLSLSSEFEFHYGSDAVNYLKELGADVNLKDISVGASKEVADKAKFSGTLTSNFNSKKGYSSEYSFASCNYIKQVKRIYLNADATLLSSYLDKVFLEDLKLKTAKEIVNIYGTHVLTDIAIGGSLNMLYSSATTTTSKVENVKAGLDVSVFKIFGLSLGVSSNTNLSTTNTYKSLKYKTTGGNNSIVGEVDLEKGTPKINISQWYNSVDKDGKNAALIRVGWEKAIPIYDLVTNATKKAELKIAVQEYIKTKILDMRTPLFRYFNTRISNHLYLTDWNDLVWGRDGYVYEGIVGYLYKSQIPGTVPLYRYYRSSGMDHFYTTNWNELGYGNHGYKYEFIVGYVYQNEEKGTIPLYRYNNSKRQDHLYTNNWNELGTGNHGYGYEWIAGYIFP